MKTALPLLLLALAILSFGFAGPDDDERTADERAVHAAVTDYVLGFYDAEPERLERCLAPDMRKLGFWRPDGADDYAGASAMTYEQALELARTWNADGSQGKDMPFEVTLYEVCDKTACAKVTAKWGQDYFQLAKEDGRWRIQNVLWQSAPRD